MFCIEEGFSGILFSVCVIGTLFVYVLFLKKAGIQMKKENRKYLAGIVLLGIDNSYTFNWVFVFLNIAATVLLFLVFMIRQFYLFSLYPLL